MPKYVLGQAHFKILTIGDAKAALNCGLVVVLKEDSESGEERYVYLGMCKKLKCLGCGRSLSGRRHNEDHFGTQSQ